MKVKDFTEYKESDHKTFLDMPCGFYDVVDINYINGKKLKRVRAGDNLFKDTGIKSWRLSEEQSIPLNDSYDGGGYFVDNTAPNLAQSFGYDDDDFDPRYM